MQSPDENQFWGPGPSLWNLISKHVHGTELPKIRTALGHSLVDAYTDIHTEAEMCHKMWQEIQRNGKYANRTWAQRDSPLPDPPAVKELVRAEVKMLLQTLSETASRGARDDEELLLRYNPETVKYALGHLDSGFTHSTKCGDIDTGSRTSSRCSVQSCNEDEIEAVRDKLNVTGIDQVVDRLKSVVMEECDMLKRLVQDLKENINQKHSFKIQPKKSEPTLMELKELRKAVQMDLDLFTSSFAALPPASSCLPVKELKGRFRRSAGQRASEETVQALTTASPLRPHPPPSPCHTNPRPPARHPVTKTSASLKAVHASSLSVSHGQKRNSPAASKQNKMPLCNKITTSEQTNSHATPGPIIVKAENDCSLSPEQGGAAVHQWNRDFSCSVQTKAQRKSPAHEAHLSSLQIIQSLSAECDLSPHRETKSSVWRSGNINVSHTPALSSLCAAGTCGNTAGHSTLTTGKPKSTCGGNLVSVGQRDKDRIRSFYISAISDTGYPPLQNCSSGIDGNKNGKDVKQDESLCSQFLTDHSSHHLQSTDEWGQGKCQPVCIQIKGQFLTSPEKPLEPKNVQEAQTELDMISKFHQPVPPAKCQLEVNH